ncbi:DUF2955 domain-containing protein, partial [Enterobacter intestinihominis]
LILFPMHYRGAVMCSIWRVVGVVLGCLYILLFQLILNVHSSQLVLIIPLIGLGLAIGGPLHVLAKVGARVGISSNNTNRIKFRQKLHTESEMVVNQLYP